MSDRLHDDRFSMNLCALASSWHLSPACQRILIKSILIGALLVPGRRQRVLSPSAPYPRLPALLLSVRPSACLAGTGSPLSETNAHVSFRRSGWRLVADAPT